MPDLCAPCLAEWINDGQPGGPEGEEFSLLHEAITLAPSWQTQVMSGQMIVACVALPTCLDHLGVREDSPLERATKGGLLLGGNGAPG